ncbi:unnamed protein product [Larinioides sclopetarius]|uniref:Uncharacterized protein n=1 Tax=Larinioides sclopetarius TaxID=280406 RepID=A0AAV2B7M1_9ARAC
MRMPKHKYLFYLMILLPNISGSSVELVFNDRIEKGLEIHGCAEVIFGSTVGIFCLLRRSETRC